MCHGHPCVCRGVQTDVVPCRLTWAHGKCLSHRDRASSNRYFNCPMSYGLALAQTKNPTCCNTLHLQLNCPKNCQTLSYLWYLPSKPIWILHQKGMNWLSETMSNPVWPALTRMSRGRITGTAVTIRGIFWFSATCQSEVRPTSTCEESVKQAELHF